MIAAERFPRPADRRRVAVSLARRDLYLKVRDGGRMVTSVHCGSDQRGPRPASSPRSFLEMPIGHLPLINDRGPWYMAPIDSGSTECGNTCMGRIASSGTVRLASRSRGYG